MVLRRKVIAFVSGKGGTGKTTNSHNLAGVLANRGDKVLIIEADRSPYFGDEFYVRPDEYKIAFKELFGDGSRIQDEDFSELKSMLLKNVLLMEKKSINIFRTFSGVNEIEGLDEALYLRFVRYLINSFEFTIINLPGGNESRDLLRYYSPVVDYPVFVTEFGDNTFEKVTKTMSLLHGDLLEKPDKYRVFPEYYLLFNKVPLKYLTYQIGSRSEQAYVNKLLMDKYRLRLQEEFSGLGIKIVMDDMKIVNPEKLRAVLGKQSVDLKLKWGSFYQKFISNSSGREAAISAAGDDVVSIVPLPGIPDALDIPKAVRAGQLLTAYTGTVPLEDESTQISLAMFEHMALFFENLKKNNRR